MAALAASDVVYTVTGRSYSPSIEDSGVRQKRLKAVFGDGAKTYPSGGVPLSGISSWGFSYTIADIFLVDDSNSDGYVYKWDFTNNKLRIYYSAGFTPAGTVAAPTFTGSALAAHGHVLYVGTGATDATGARVNAATNVLEMNNAGASIASIASATGNGGIVQVTAGTPAGTNSAPAFTGTAVAAGVLTEVSTSFAPASATTIYMFVRGR